MKAAEVVLFKNVVLTSILSVSWDFFVCLVVCVVVCFLFGWCVLFLNH